MSDNPIPLYGVWIPGVGWLRGNNQQAYADTNKAVAREIAGRLGDGAKAYYIDPVIIDREQMLLDAEKKPKWWRRYAIHKRPA